MSHPDLHPETIQKLGAAAYPAFAMLAAMQLDLFTPLAAGPMEVGPLAAALGVGPARLAPLLYALVAAGLLHCEAGRFGNTPEADAFLVQGRPGYMGDRHRFYTARYRELEQTAASIRTGHPQARLDFAAMAPEAMAAYLRGLHPATKGAGRFLAQRPELASRRHLLDVGGGSGGLAIALGTLCPRLRVTVLDLPPVAPITRGFIEEAGLGARIQATAGDAVRGPLTGSYDVAVLRAFIQVLAPEEARRALQNVFGVLEPGSPVLILGQVLDDSRLSPPPVVAFNLVFLNVYEDGQAYTEAEYRDWLRVAGFTGFERTVLPGGDSLILARKP